MKAFLRTLLTLLICGFAAALLNDFLQRQQTVLTSDEAEADLVFNHAKFKKYNFGFEGLLADYYWISALQYVGGKLIKNNGLQSVQLDNLKLLDPRLLYPMLDAATTLDPDFLLPYSYGSTILPAINVEHAIKISEKGIAAQPENWRLYHNLGYIHWKNNDFARAAETYARGASKPNAPIWMQTMSAKMSADGNSRDTARAIYQQVYANAPDEQTKTIAAQRLLQLEAGDELDAMNSALGDFQTKNLRCANDWRELSQVLRTIKLPSNRNLTFDANGAPLDPSQTPYLLVSKDNECAISLDAEKTAVLRD